jgi:hypothetical protein
VRPFLAILLGGCALLAPQVPTHEHLRAELGLSCAETCAPWSCEAAFDVGSQAEIACESDAHRFALCICRPPSE